MNISVEEKPFINTSEKQILDHLISVDSVLAPYAPNLAKPPYKNLLTPEPFAMGRDQFEPKDLVAVHLTNTFPENGIIHPTAFYHPDTLRFTSHFAINSLAPRINIFGWNWEQRKYGILVPFDKIKARVLAFNPADTFILEDIELPEGTIVLKDSSDVTAPIIAGKARVVEIDYSNPGERLNGFQKAVYEQMIEMGYFPQVVNEYGEWYLWGMYGLPDGRTINGREIWVEFCKVNNLEFAKGNPHTSHWTGRMEDLAYYIEYYAKENQPEGLRGVVEEAQSFLESTEVPDKYKHALTNLVRKYRP